MRVCLCVRVFVCVHVGDKQEHGSSEIYVPAFVAAVGMGARMDPSGRVYVGVKGRVYVRVCVCV